MTDVFADLFTTGPFAPPAAHPDEAGPPRAHRADAVVLAVSDARRTARHYATALALRCTAYSGPETGNPESLAYVLEAGDLRFVVTSVLQPLTEHGRLLAARVAAHGDGVFDLAVEVPDAYAAYDYAVDRGATPVTEPYEVEDRYGIAVIAVIATPAGRHTLVDRTAYPGPYLPGFLPPPPGVL
ncbi:4-hydroxyphenylpyruvate dioxygenase [Kitasatospora sp. MMS16-BH015]|uniref:VOC family protein n=1 Tax=Kitasatospora sp. MMS16-BH015 TaxID=2018025 RepID=UPI000CA23681|nr:VOC family protein [Kitasatospora sp. MMS16-BH015]AUG77481.1 4-hydroxyphenylpyruvate dioxygenase [Kitasatospora sp. MMS16-BH015]